MSEDDFRKKHKGSDLQKLFTEAEEIDQEVFSEQRTNILLIAGEHYQRNRSNFYRRIRTETDLTTEQKLRLTKNHVQRIYKEYCNTILSAAPGVGFTPHNESEIQDQKAAELHHAVWQDALEKYNLRQAIDDWCDDFNGIGEVAVKVFYDPGLGDIKGYGPVVDENEEPVFNELGEMQPDQNNPVMRGGFIFERIYGFNLLRAPEAQTMDESDYIIIRKMVSKDTLMEKYGEDKDISRAIKGSGGKTFMVFDGNTSSYKKTENECMVTEFYFRKCPKYPTGYYFINIEDQILEEGELPGGIFPIVFAPFEKVATSPRGRSAVKTMRPYQMEINRSASKIAEHQITLGDDKLIIQNGTTMSQGKSLPGVRSIQVSGAEPTILEGRDGSQYLNYMNSQISELYNVMGVEEKEIDAQNNLEPFSLLFMAAKRKKKLQRHISRFEQFLINVAKTYLKLAKIYLSEDDFIKAVGRNEAINITEFKNSNDLCYEINIEPQADDIETKLGKQLVLNNALQYLGSKLEREDIGKVLRAMPFANLKESFDDMTIDYDSMKNDLLALDRGENPPISKYDNNVYCIKRLVNRMRMADFKLLHPQIQMNYEARITTYQQLEADRLRQVQAMNADFIPTDGPLVVVDFYVRDPVDPNKTKRARLPHSSILWLVQRLEDQGQTLDQLEQLNPGAVAGISEQYTQLPETQIAGAAPQGPVPQLGGVLDGAGTATIQ